MDKEITTKPATNPLSGQPIVVTHGMRLPAKDLIHLKHEYVVSGLSYAQIDQKYNLSKGYTKAQGARYKWVADKQKYLKKLDAAQLASLDQLAQNDLNQSLDIIYDQSQEHINLMLNLQKEALNGDSTDTETYKRANLAGRSLNDLIKTLQLTSRIQPSSNTRTQSGTGSTVNLFNLSFTGSAPDDTQSQGDTGTINVTPEQP